MWCYDHQVRLTELAPRWLGMEGRHGMGISFTCPHCHGKAGLQQRLAIGFHNPLDGKPPYSFPGFLLWQREGETFDDLSISPSVDASRSGHWHGFIRNGEIH
jgi:hypothetical protein